MPELMNLWIAELLVSYFFKNTITFQSFNLRI